MVADNIEIGPKNKIPLWLFGFLAGFFFKERLEDCYQEAEEILKVMAAYKKKIQA